MKIHTATVRFGAKVGLPNYSNIEASVELAVEIDDSDDLAAVEHAVEEAKGIVRRQLLVAKREQLTREVAQS